MKIDHVKFIKDISKTYDGSAEFSLTVAERNKCLTFYDKNNYPIDVGDGGYGIDGMVRFLAKNAEGEYVDSPEAGKKSYMQFTVKLYNKNYVLQHSDDTEPASEWLCTQDGGANFTITQSTVSFNGQNYLFVTKNLKKTYQVNLAELLKVSVKRCCDQIVRPQHLFREF